MATSLITRVKGVRDGGHVFLNDGVYGGLTELPLIGNLDRIEVLTPQGTVRRGRVRPRPVFGPTCDSVDRLPGELQLPDDIAEGDYVVIHGAGAYSVVTNTRFNGFGELRQRPDGVLVAGRVFRDVEPDEVDMTAQQRGLAARP